MLVVSVLAGALAAVTGFGISKMRFKGHVAWLPGALSGMLGGLVGNKGGLRSAALLGFGLSKETFVATATAVGLVVDGARIPVYLATQRREMTTVGVVIAVATLGVVVGTLAGGRVLARIPDRSFGRVLAVVLAGLGAVMVGRSLGL